MHSSFLPFLNKYYYYTNMAYLLFFMYYYRSGQKHLLHLFIQPHLTNFTIRLRGSTVIAMNFLVQRCSSNLKCLELMHNDQMPLQRYIDFLGKFHNLIKLNVYASSVDDKSFAQIGKNCDKLIELNAGKTWLTNTGR